MSTKVSVGSVGRSPGRLKEYVLVFDGGSQGNPGPTYGSYRFGPKGGHLRNPMRLVFEEGTNNEAEYQSLIAGVRGILEELKSESFPASAVRLEVRGDSQLVIRQLEGTWKAKDSRMRGFRDEARSLLDAFGDVRYTYQPRSRTVRLLGH
jgi:ribonuclease HI